MMFTKNLEYYQQERDKAFVEDSGGSALRRDVIEVQKEKIHLLKAEIARLTKQRASYEKQLVLEQSKHSGLETSVAALLTVVGILAAQLSNGPAAQRRARAEARRTLELHGIAPPATLGRSRRRG